MVFLMFFFWRLVRDLMLELPIIGFFEFSFICSLRILMSNIGSCGTVENSQYGRVGILNFIAESKLLGSLSVRAFCEVSRLE